MSNTTCHLCGAATTEPDDYADYVCPACGAKHQWLEGYGVAPAEIREQFANLRAENKRWREAFWDKSNGESEYCKYVSTPEGARAMMDTHVEEAVETDKQIGNLLAVVDAVEEAQFFPDQDDYRYYFIPVDDVKAIQSAIETRKKGGV